MNRSVVEVLRDARNLLGQGWCQDAGRIIAFRGQGHDRYCAVVAIDDNNPMARLPSDNTTTNACKAVCQVLGLSATDWVDCLVKWNDTPYRNKDEVLAAFDRAIATQELAIAIQEIEDELSTLEEKEHEPELTTA